MEGAGGIEPPPRFLDDANGFAARGVPSTTAPPSLIKTVYGLGRRSPFRLSSKGYVKRIQNDLT
jgi:hypothetical protein